MYNEKLSKRAARVLFNVCVILAVEKYNNMKRQRR